MVHATGPEGAFGRLVRVQPVQLAVLDASYGGRVSALFDEIAEVSENRMTSARLRFILAMKSLLRVGDSRIGNGPVGPSRPAKVFDFSVFDDQDDARRTSVRAAAIRGLSRGPAARVTR